MDYKDALSMSRKYPSCCSPERIRERFFKNNAITKQAEQKYKTDASDKNDAVDKLDNPT